jgi:hypothetical protein
VMRCVETKPTPANTTYSDCKRVQHTGSEKVPRQEFLQFKVVRFAVSNESVTLSHGSAGQIHSRSK